MSKSERVLELMKSGSTRIMYDDPANNKIRIDKETWELMLENKDGNFLHFEKFARGLKSGRYEVTNTKKGLHDFVLNLDRVISQNIYFDKAKDIDDAKFCKHCDITKTLTSKKFKNTKCENNYEFLGEATFKMIAANPQIMTTGEDKNCTVIIDGEWEYTDWVTFEKLEQEYENKEDIIAYRVIDLCWGIDL